MTLTRLIGRHEGWLFDVLFLASLAVALGPLVLVAVGFAHPGPWPAVISSAGWLGVIGSIGGALWWTSGGRTLDRLTREDDDDRDAVLNAVFDDDGMRPYVTPTADRMRKP